MFNNQEGDGMTFGTLEDQFEGNGDSLGFAHQNIAAMEPTEGIIINRTKSGISPFVEIRKERLVDQLTHQPTKSFGVWMEDEEAEGGNRYMGVVSEDYLLLPNAKVRDLALEIAEESGYGYQESRIFWDGVRFAHIIDFTSVTEDVEDEKVGLSLITRTSYDKSWRYEASLMGKHFVCDNGCLSGEFFARVSFKHTSGGDPWESVVKEGLSVIQHGQENLSHYADGLRILKHTPMADQRLRDIWGMLHGIPDKVKGRIIDRYVAKEEPTLYGLLQAGTYTFWHAEKSTAQDYANNNQYTTALLDYAFSKAGSN